MNNSLGQILVIVSDSGADGTFWKQMLVLVILAVAAGIFSLVKTRAKRFQEQQDYSGAGHRPRTQRHRRIGAVRELKDKWLGVLSGPRQSKAALKERVPGFGVAAISKQGDAKKQLATRKNLTSGMEMLGLDFLVMVVENTKDGDNDDVMMRKFSFDELVRRSQLKAVDSNSLRVYALDEDNFYGKDIQCEAMKELTERTRPGLG